MKPTIRGRSGLFAHLISLGGQRAAEDDEPEDKKEDESAEDEDAEDADDDADEKKSKKAKKAKAKAEDDDDGEKVEDDDESAEDGDDDGKEKAAVIRERTRCARIIAHGIKAGCVEQAGVLAFDSNLTASTAINTLKAMGASGGKNVAGNLSSMMSMTKNPDVGTDAAPAPDANSASGMVARMTSVYDRVTGGKK